VSKLGVQTGEPLTVDLTDRTIDSWSALWDSLTVPCGLPDWFGRNLDAWMDTIRTGAISEVIDAHPRLLVRVRSAGIFASGNPEGAAFVEVTERSGYGRVEVNP
jgi:hypothetical protein